MSRTQFSGSLILVAAVVAIVAIVAVAATSLVPTRAMAQESRPPDEVNTLAKEWSAALEAGKVELMKPMLSPDYIYVNPLGKAVDGETLLRTLKGKKLHFKIEPEDRKLRMHADAMVMTGVCHITGEIDGRKLDGDYRYLDVFQKKDGRWIAIASTMTAVAEPS